MTRIAKAIAAANAENRAALIVYICAGDPDLSTTARLLRTISDSGADIIELGVPFSDPTADGEVIQRASERALKSGTTLRKILQMLKETRSTIQCPILLFGYYNPILAYGEKELVGDAAGAGVDGLLVVDLPPEAANDLHEACVENELAFVPLLAPTSTAERVGVAKKLARGFVYYVSLTGVTGAQGVDLKSAARQAAVLSNELALPVALGFGIKNAENVQQVRDDVQGVVVGSAVVQTMHNGNTIEEGIDGVASLVRTLRQACLRTDSL